MERVFHLGQLRVRMQGGGSEVLGLRIFGYAGRSLMRSCWSGRVDGMVRYKMVHCWVLHAQ